MYNKAIKVIDSCETREQWEVAVKYCILVMRKYRDLDLFYKLKNSIISRYLKIDKYSCDEFANGYVMAAFDYKL